jgi:hypothetical protein
MHPLAPAIEIAERIRGALNAELAAARDQREMIRKLDADGLTERAARRADFNGKLAALEGDLGRALAAAGEQLGLRTVTLEALSARAPAESRRLGRAFADLRALAESLRRTDALNHLLAERALACVRGYVTALAPVPAAYDRRGAATESVALSTARRMA